MEELAEGGKPSPAPGGVALGRGRVEGNDPGRSGGELEGGVGARARHEDVDHLLGKRRALAVEGVPGGEIDLRVVAGGRGIDVEGEGASPGREADIRGR